MGLEGKQTHLRHRESRGHWQTHLAQSQNCIISHEETCHQWEVQWETFSKSTSVPARKTWDNVVPHEATGQKSNSNTMSSFFGIWKTGTCIRQSLQSTISQKTTTTTTKLWMSTSAHDYVLKSRLFHSKQARLCLCLAQQCHELTEAFRGCLLIEIMPWVDVFFFIHHGHHVRVEFWPAALCGKALSPVFTVGRGEAKLGLKMQEVRQTQHRHLESAGLVCQMLLIDMI